MDAIDWLLLLYILKTYGHFDGIPSWMLWFFGILAVITAITKIYKECSK